MTVSIIFIGDPHFQVSNIPEVDIFIEKMTNLAKERQPDLIIIGGDVLHTHERLHTIPLNKAYEFIDKMRQISKTYVLVGNHDMCNNQQFLSQNHWMNSLKEWENTVIVDKVISEIISDEKFVFVPYVYPGRFEEALNTLEEGWNDASCIFAHQEFAGCKMGAIVSVEGDRWDLSNPHVVSGHIHSRQIPQSNIYYTGSSMQHAFGESEQNIIAYLTFNFNKAGYDREEIDLELPRKKIVYMDIDNIDEYQIKETDDKIKITISGDHDDFKAFKKTKKYKEIIDKGVKVNFKPKRVEIRRANEDIEERKNDYVNTETTTESFQEILSTIVIGQKDPLLLQAYELVVNNRQTQSDDVFFIE